jgi:hypothetical protein
LFLFKKKLLLLIFSKSSSPPKNDHQKYSQKVECWLVNKCLSTIDRWPSTIFQLYRGRQFYWWRKPDYPKKNTDLPHIYLYFETSCNWELVTVRLIVLNIKCYQSLNVGYENLNCLLKCHTELSGLIMYNVREWKHNIMI